MLLTALGITLAVSAGFWIAGGVVLRLGGILLTLLGLLVLTSTQSIAGLIVLAVGALLWLTGHWHYALRHHAYKSPLARRIFLQLLPARLDPTRGWAVPITDAPPRRHGLS